MKAEPSLDEYARLEALRSYGVLDTPPEQLYDEIVTLAAHICQVPISAISLIDEERQWFKSIVGLAVAETPRDIAFCAHTILGSDLLVVEDTTTDPRFADNPLVLADPNIRFYAGAPLVTPGGQALGSICVLDSEPRTLSDEQLDALRMLGRQVVSQLELRVKLEQLAKANAEREQATAEVELIHRRQRIAVAGAPVVLFALDEDGVFELSEGGGLERLGLSGGELVGRSVFDHYADTPAILSQVRRALAGERVNEELELGELVLELSYRPITDQSGEVTGVVGLACDITERVQVRGELLETNSELRRSREQVLEASRLKAAFLANMSHEIRTPLNGVVGMAELLRESASDEEQRGYADIAVTSAETLLALIDDILDLSMIEAGQLALRGADFSPRKTVDEVCDTLAATAHDKGIALDCSVEESVPATVCGDEQRFRQVLANLVSNAVKFTPSGRVEATLSASAPADQVALLRVEVTDTGIGVETSRIDELFDPFHQADVSVTREFGGTGLGLAISKELVELMGGEIGAFSEPERGSTFWFTTEVRTPNPPPPSPIHGKTDRARILVVEDDFINQQVAEAMVNGLGYECVLAANGLDALNCLTQGDFAAILMDCQMPVLDGYEASARIRALDGEVRHTPIIAMTANAREGDRERCLAAEMDDYIAKPVRSALLGEMLERWVTPMVRRRGQGSGQRTR